MEIITKLGVIKYLSTWILVLAKIQSLLQQVQVLFRNGEIVKTFYSLIRPEPDYYKWFCQQVHGLGHEDTDDSEVFPFVWRRMTEGLLEGVQILSEDTADCPDALPLVAHNAGFDSGRCLRIRPYQSSPCPSRCRGLRVDRESNTLEQILSIHIRIITI
jgi:DNA polymerase III epsilon subunit-like protein